MTSSESTGGSLGRLWRQLSPRRHRQFFAVLALMLLGALAEVVTLGAILPFLAVIADPAKITSYPLLDDAMATIGLSQSNLLLVLTLMFATAAVLAGAIRVLLAWASNKYVFMLGLDLGMQIYERVLYQPYAWHVSRNTSEVIAAINKVQMVTQGLLLPLMQAISAVLIGFFILAALLLVDPAISLTAFAGFGLIYLSVSVVTRKTLRANSLVIARSQSSRIQSVQEGLGGIRDVILDSSQPIFLERFRRLDTDLRNAQATSTFIGAAPRFVVEAAGMVLIALLAYVMTAGEGGLATVLPVLGALALGAQRLLPLMQQVYGGWTRIAANADVLVDVVSLLEKPMPAETLQASEPALPFEHAITLRCVSFAYGPQQAPILEDVDLIVRKGARIGIVGKTGSGKSTLIDLVMGLLEPTAGCVEVDGRPLDGRTRRGWQTQIAHVPQSIFLSDSSIAENIAFGIEAALIDQGRVREASRGADIASFIESLPCSYDTMVGERGVRLSGGQRQRIGIARALYKQAQVLILDEATSALDSKTEEIVMRSIDRLDRSLTILVIAHRTSTLAGCDSILHVSDRRVERQDESQAIQRAPMRCGTAAPLPNEGGSA